MAVYAVADLHGRYDIFEKVKEFIKPEDVVYVIGDCSDRGKDGWQIIKEVYANPQFIYLKGNHEEMLAKAMIGDKQLCFLNHGKKTYEAWKYKDGRDMSWYTKLRDLPLYETYTNKNGKTIILCHSGFTPGTKDFRWDDEYIWNRAHFDEEWMDGFEDTYVIHGHTPIPLMEEYLWGAEPEEEEVFWYSEDKNGVPHKCNIDCAAFWTNYTILLNLDDFTETIIRGEKINEW